MLRHWLTLSKHGRRLLAVGGWLLLVMVTAIAATVWDMRQSAIQDAEGSIAQLGIAISEQTARSVQAADAVIQGMQGRFLAGGVATPEGFKAFFAAQPMQQDWAAHGSTLPQVVAFSAVDASGEVANSTRGPWPALATDVSDRNYFTYFRDHDDRGLQVTRPSAARWDGAPTVFLVRRASGPDGEFLGVLLAALDLGYFQRFYELLGAGDTSVTLLRADGALLTRYPLLAGSPATMPAASPWYAAAAQGSGKYESKGAFGHSTRLISVHRLADYPIVVSVGVSKSQVLASWRREALLIGLGTACAIVCVGLLLQAMGVQLRRLERSEASLAARNGALQQTQAGMRR